MDRLPPVSKYRELTTSAGLDQYQLDSAFRHPSGKVLATLDRLQRQVPVTELRYIYQLI
jgi:hypothetical protein